MVHVAVNKYDFEKINILEYAFGEGGGGHQKAYAVYAFINVDNCERPLSETALKLMQSYLTNRKQYVEINNTQSTKNDITVGVPQGSILRPLLFII